jgi:hypothetical protein
MLPAASIEASLIYQEMRIMSDDSRKIRFGLWYDFRNPPQWRQSSDRLYREILDQIAWGENNVLRLFQPEHDPASIKPKRTYARRTWYFARTSCRGCAWPRSERRMAR